jgi:hypothetical protein
MIVLMVLSDRLLDYAVTGRYEPEWLEKIAPSAFALKSYPHHALLTVAVTFRTFGIPTGMADIVLLLRAVPDRISRMLNNVRDSGSKTLTDCAKETAVGAANCRLGTNVRLYS